MLALHRPDVTRTPSTPAEATRRALDEQWGLEPSPETRALQMMILTHDPAIASSQPVRPAVGKAPAGLAPPRRAAARRRPRAGAGGAALEDVRTTAADVAAARTAASSRPSRVSTARGGSAPTAPTRTTSPAPRAAVELREILRGRAVAARYAVGTGRVLVWDSNPVLVGTVLGRTRRAARRRGRRRPVHRGRRSCGRRRSSWTWTGDCSPSGRRPSSRSTAAPRRPRRRARRPARRLRRRRRDGAAASCSRRRRRRHREEPARRGVRGDVPAVVLRAACVSYGEGISFLPLLDLWETAAAVDDGVPPLGELASADAAFAAARGLVEHFTRSGPSWSSSTTCTGPC